MFRSKLRILLVALPLVAAAPAHAAGSEDSSLSAAGRTSSDTFHRGTLGALAPGDRGEAVIAFLRPPSLQQEAGAEELVVHRMTRDERGRVHVRVHQRIHGLPVVGSEMIVHVDDRTGEVYAMSGRLAATTGLPARPALSAEQAAERIAALTEDALAASSVRPELVYRTGADGRPQLAWRASVRYKGARRLRSEDVLVDAMSGALLARRSHLRRMTAATAQALPVPSNAPRATFSDIDDGICIDDDFCTDPSLQSIHDNVGQTYNFYERVLGRRSIDDGGGAGREVIAYGHVGFDDAFFDPRRIELNFGDGLEAFRPGAMDALDLVAHEYTHAVSYFEVDFDGANESGALDEAFSDIMAAAVEAWVDGRVSADTWKCGEDVFALGPAARYMNDPALDGESSDYYPDRLRLPPFEQPDDANDYGFIHANSGIANLAFYLVATGGRHPRGVTAVTVPRLGIEKARQIFYTALTGDYMLSTSDFEEARDATVLAADELYGLADGDAVISAWCAVGVGACP